MEKIIALIALLIFSVNVPHSVADTPKVRIMPLGDSLTSGYTLPVSSILSGYRDRLYTLLADAGYNVDFVGTQPDTQDPPMPNLDHEGHGGSRIDEIGSGIEGWLDASDPDVILLLIGTNDFWQNHDWAGAGGRLENLVAQITTLRPYAKILLANLPNQTVYPNEGQETAQSAFNASIPGIVSGQVSQGRQVYFVDMHGSFDASGLSSDGVHPNATGYNKMADAWSLAIMQVITPQGAPPSGLANGSFEVGALVNSSPFPQHQLDGWTITHVPSGNPPNPAFGFPANADFIATDGSRVALLNGGGDNFSGAISQTISTVPGTVYTLQFDVGIFATAGEAPREQLLGVSVTGADNGSLLAVTEDQVHLTAINGPSQWKTKKYSFTANSTTTKLTFLDRSGNLVTPIASECDLLLDKVRVSEFSFPNTAPVANVQSVSMEQDDTLAITLTANDSDSPTFTVATPPTHGTLSLTGARAVYTPTLGYSGMDSFTFIAYDGMAVSVPAMVSIDIEFSILVNGSFEIGAHVSSNPFPQYQVNGWTVNHVPSGNPSNPVFGFPTNADFPATDGSRMALLNGGTDNFTGTLAQTFETIPGATYHLDFDCGIIVAAGKAPRQQLLGVAVTGQGGGTLLSQDVALTAIEGPAQWTARSYSFTATTTTSTLVFTDKSGTLVLNAADFSDLLLDHVRVTATSNNPPVAVNDGGVAMPFLTVSEDSPAPAPLAVLTNDSDPELDTLTITLANSANGLVDIVASGTALSFTPTANFNGTTTISYTISDGKGGTATATVFVTVTPVTDNFVEWLAEFEMTGNPGDDPDQDSITNAVEYVIGGNPEDPSDVSLQPNISLVSEIPNPNFSIGNYLLFTYRRTDSADNDTSTTIATEWSEDLTGPWTTADGTHGEVIVEVPNGAGNGIDRVNVYIPCPQSGKLFGRLGVTIATP